MGCYYTHRGDRFLLGAQNVNDVQPGNAPGSGPNSAGRAPTIPEASPQLSFRLSRCGHIALCRFGFDHRMGQRGRIDSADHLFERRGNLRLCRLGTIFCSQGQIARAANSLLIAAESTVPDRRGRRWETPCGPWLLSVLRSTRRMLGVAATPTLIGQGIFSWIRGSRCVAKPADPAGRVVSASEPHPNRSGSVTICTDTHAVRNCTNMTLAGLLDQSN